MEAQVELEILHIPVLYPTDMSTSSQSMLGILRRFTLDPGISDQFTETSEIGILNRLHRKTNSTSKHHLQKNDKGYYRKLKKVSPNMYKAGLKEIIEFYKRSKSNYLFKWTFEKSFLAAALVNILKPHCGSTRSISE